jgi:hypothetical protein
VRSLRCTDPSKVTGRHHRKSGAFKRLAMLLLFVASPLCASPDGPAGSRMCAGCHPKQARLWQNSPMGRALELPGTTPLLRAGPELQFREGRFAYRLYRDGDRLVYNVTDGQESITAPVRSIFGPGVAGQTFIVEHQGQLYESRVSYYKARAGLDLTIGALPQPRTATEALGRVMTSADVRECYTCHATTQVRDGKVDIAAVVPGVQCETCHGPGAAHAASAGRQAGTAMKKLRESGAEEMNELCGTCHRTWAVVAANGPHNIVNVRFQPYRITKSKCFDADDPRIRCSACHDPHDRVNHEARSYDKACEACHTSRAGAKSGARTCPIAKAGCASCHMPKYTLPQSHFEFSDHYIRVVRPNEQYPN